MHCTLSFFFLPHRDMWEQKCLMQSDVNPSLTCQLQRRGDVRLHRCVTSKVNSLVHLPLDVMCAASCALYPDSTFAKTSECSQKYKSIWSGLFPEVGFTWKKKTLENIPTIHVNHTKNIGCSSSGYIGEMTITLNTESQSLVSSNGHFVKCGTHYKTVMSWWVCLFSHAVCGQSLWLLFLKIKCCGNGDKELIIKSIFKHF